MSTAVLGVGGTIAAAGTVAGAGASIYGASQSGSGGSPMPQLTPKQSLMSYLKGLDKGLPMLMGMEQTYRPQFGELNQNDQSQYLDFLLGLGGKVNTAGADQLQSSRQKEYANMLGNAGSVLGILGGIDPAGKRQAEQATALADNAYNRAMGPLSFQDKRSTDQQSRELFGARGRVNDNVSVMSELLGRESVKRDQREEAAALGSQAFALNQAYTSPAMSLLLGVPAGMSLGQDYLNRSASAIGANTPQFINPDAGMNMGLQQNANIASYNQAQAAQQAGQAQMWGQIGSALMGAGANYFTKK